MIPPSTAATPWPEPLSPRLHDHLVSPDRMQGLATRRRPRPAVPVTWEAQDTHVGRAWVPVAVPTTDRRMPWTYVVAALARLVVVVTRQPWVVEARIWLALHQPQSVREVAPATPVREEWPDAHTWTIGTGELHQTVNRWTADATALVGASR